MDKPFLERCLTDGMSLPQIGELTGRDPSTVGYWVQKYRLTANGRAKFAPRGGLTREQLEPLVEAGATLQEMAEVLDRSVSTVRHWLAKYGLHGRAHRGRRARVPREIVDAARAAGDRTVEGLCPLHGETTFVIETSGRARCRKCRMSNVSEWRRRVKRRLVEEAGGRCKLCGYTRCMAALQFHHLDPAQKSFALSRKGVTRGFAELRAEAAKCVLLCANCHAEVEAGHTKI
jgi:transposase